MDFNSLLDQVIDEGIIAAKDDYCKDYQKEKLDGSLKGFEECRGKSVPELYLLLQESAAKTTEKHRDQASDYWYWRCRAAEIEWVCNAMSAVLLITKQAPIINPTARGYLKMVEIIRKNEGFLAVREEA